MTDAETRAKWAAARAVSRQRSKAGIARVSNGHDRPHLAEPRPRPVLMAMLAERHAWYLRQPQHRRDAIDSERFLPVPELHALLAQLEEHGHFADETSYGRPLGWVA